MRFRLGPGWQKPRRAPQWVPSKATTAVTLTVGDLTSASTLDAPTLGGSIPTNDLASAGTLDNATLTQVHVLSVSSLTSAATLDSVAFAVALYPATKSGRKWLDQNGNPIQIRAMSSWGLVQRLGTSDIQTAVADAAGRGFNCLIVDFAAGMNLGTGWTPGQNSASGHTVWTGTAFQSTLGTLWTNEITTLMNELTSRGMYCIVSCYAGNGSQTTTKGAMASASLAQMRTSGQRWATALAGWNNWAVHYGLDDTAGPDDKFDQLVRGIEETIGHDILVVGEPNQGSDALAQWTAGTFTYADMEEAMYQYDSSHTSDWVLLWRSTYSGDPRTPDGPTWDCEPLYIGHSSSSPERLEKRYRHYALPIEGAIGINNGHENWWGFGAAGVGFDAGDTWDTAMDNTMVQDMQRGWAIWDLVNSTGWDATTSFVTTGAGATGSTAAQGTDGTRAIAYFPNNRTVQVNTTILTGSGNVKLRWYDPALGTYSTIASSEAQQTGRAVTYPSNHSDSTADYVLVVELVQVDLTVSDLTSAATLGAATLTQVHVLVASDLSSAATLAAATLTQVHVLAAGDLSSAATLDSVTLAQVHVLVAADLSSAATLDAATLTQIHVLAASDLASASTLDAAALTQVHILATGDLSSAATLDNAVLTVGGISLTVADLLSPATLDGPALTQVHILAVDTLSSAATLDLATITVNSDLAVAGLASAATLDAATLGVGGILLTVADLSSVAALGAPVLTGVHILAVDVLVSTAVLGSVAWTVIATPDPRQLIRVDRERTIEALEDRDLD